MSWSPIRPLLAVAALAAMSGCVSDSYRLPPLEQSGGGLYVPYAPYMPYAPGYAYYGPGAVYSFVHPGYYDPRYPGYGAYRPYYYGPGLAAPFPFGPYYYPFPRYVPAPCVDNNHDGHCDRQPDSHGSPPPRDGHGQGDRNYGRLERYGDFEGRTHVGAGGAPGVTRPPAPTWSPPPSPRPPTPSQPQNVDPKAQNAQPQRHRGQRDHDDPRLPDRLP